MTNPQSILAALRALSAARDGSVPYERTDIAGNTFGMARFAVSTAGYVFILFARALGGMPRVTEWRTPDGARVADADSVVALNGADDIVRPRLNTDFGRRVVTPEDAASAWRAAADFLNNRNRSQETAAP